MVRFIIFTLLLTIFPAMLPADNLPDSLALLKTKLLTLAINLGENKENLVAKKLENIAITDGYGYKTANLTLLSNLCEELNKKSKNNIYAFSVPQFFGISSNEMQTFVNDILKIDLAQEWGGLIKFYSIKDDTWLTTAIASKQFPEGFLAGAKKIEDEINTSFDTYIKDKPEDINTLFGNINNIDMLKKLAPDEKLMVRSTGKEDTDKLANAGGNESVANVSPNTKEILEAMKIVMASYFSEKSLTQRLGAGDPSIPEAPFTPVLVQRMIGEKINEPLPRCGVMFTEETEGALSKKCLKKHKEIKTSGITIIQCAFGHNEGVVNSIVPVDTYIVDSDGQQHAVIRPKPFRIAPAKEALKLERKDNDPDYINRPVLEPDAISAMKQLATALEIFYKKPMDVEFVIFNNTIYIVQARPIVHNLAEPEPSYLNFNNKKVTGMKYISCSAIGSGGGELKFITNNKQLVVKKTIGAALSEYQERVNKNDIKTILTGEDAPVTSHEATAFRSELKPVIYVPEKFSDIEQWTKNETLKLLIDTQQQRIVQWAGDETFDLNTFKDNDLAKDNWINYPMAQRISVYNAPKGEKLKTLEKDLNNRLFSKMTQQALTEAAEEYQKEQNKHLFFLHKQINIIKTGNENEVTEALWKVMIPVNQLVRISKIKNPVYLNKIKNLKAYMSQVCFQILENMNIEQNNENYMSKRLFPIHILETLLFQDHKDYEGLYGDSVIKLWRQMHEEEKGAIGLEGKEEITKLLGILGNSALTPELQNSWKKFVSELDKQGLSWKQIKQHQRLLTNKTIVLLDKPENKAKIDFFQTIRTLNKVGLLELWLHTSFAKNSDIKNINNLNKDIADAKDFLNTLATYKKKVETFSTEGFSDPQKFIKVWGDFKKYIFFDFVSNDFIENFKKTNGIGKLAAINIMQIFVTKFDTAIKTVTGSNLYKVTTLPEKETLDSVKNNELLLKKQIRENKDKIFTFHIMLEDYLTLLQQWLKVSSLETNFGKIVNEWANKRLTLLAAKTNDSNQKEAKNFNVAAVVIGGSAKWDEQETLIDTHEKFFMWTHQSLLAILAGLMKNDGIQETQYPKELQEINKKILALDNRIELIGSLLDKKQLTLLYNYPQRLHSALIKVLYNAQKCIVTFNLFGKNTENRWELCSGYVEFKSVEYNIPCSVSCLESGFEASWTMENKDPSKPIINNINNVIEMIQKLCEATNALPGDIAKILQKDLTLDAKSIKVFAKFDYIYPGIEKILTLAAQSTNKDIIDNVFIILEKMLDPTGDYALNSEKLLYLCEPKGEQTLPRIINETLETLFEKNAQSITKEHIKILLDNQEYVVNIVGEYLNLIPNLTDENKRTFITQAFYSLEKGSERVTKIKELTQFEGKDLATFILGRGINIFRIKHNPEMLSTAMSNMKKSEKKSFFTFLSKALEHRDFEIKKNAFDVLADIIQNSENYGSPSSDDLKVCLEAVKKALEHQDEKIKKLAIDFFVRVKGKTIGLSNEILETNVEFVVNAYIEKIKKSEFIDDLEENKDLAMEFADKKEILKILIESEYTEKLKILIDQEKKHVNTIFTFYGPKMDDKNIERLKITYLKFKDYDDIIKHANKMLIDTYLTRLENKGLKENLEILGDMKNLKYDDIKYFVTLIAKAIKSEGRVANINNAFKAYLKPELEISESFVDAGEDIKTNLTDQFKMLEYLILLSINERNLSTIVPITISRPVPDTKWTGGAMRCFYLLKEYSAKDMYKKLITIEGDQDPFLDRAYIYDFITKHVNNKDAIKTFAEIAADIIESTGNFEKLKQLLLDTKAISNKSLSLTDSQDILQYLILLNTKRYQEIPKAIISSNTKEMLMLPTSLEKIICIDLLDEFVEDNREAKKLYTPSGQEPQEIKKPLEIKEKKITEKKKPSGAKDIKIKIVKKFEKASQSELEIFFYNIMLKNEKLREPLIPFAPLKYWRENTLKKLLQEQKINLIQFSYSPIVSPLSEMIETFVKNTLNILVGKKFMGKEEALKQATKLKEEIITISHNVRDYMGLPKNLNFDMEKRSKIKNNKEHTKKEIETELKTLFDESLLSENRSVGILIMEFWNEIKCSRIFLKEFFSKVETYVLNFLKEELKKKRLELTNILDPISMKEELQKTLSSIQKSEDNFNNLYIKSIESLKNIEKNTDATTKYTVFSQNITDITKAITDIPAMQYTYGKDLSVLIEKHCMNFKVKAMDKGTEGEKEIVEKKEK